MGKRRKAREIILKTLFQMDVGKCGLEESLQYALGRVQNPKIVDYAGSVVRTTCENLTEIDRIISEKSKNWRLERIAHVDKNILRMAVCEILYREDIPASVTINEAVELSKIYGTEDSGKFINGILGSLAETREEEV
ncbi:MAG: transcription antitermination factor NusB [bacterium]